MQPIVVPPRWTLIVPLKSTARGKSRIDVEPTLRPRLAMAMALDTVAAAAAAESVDLVLVVVESRADGDEFAALPGVQALLTRAAGLNEAVDAGISALPAGFAGPLAVLPADLPSLTAAELTGALTAAARRRRSVVADRQGTGTTLLTALSAAALRPQYGAGSLARHVSAGAVPLELPVESGLRRDVDEAADLIGVSGPRTLALLGPDRTPAWTEKICAGSAG